MRSRCGAPRYPRSSGSASSRRAGRARADARLPENGEFDRGQVFGFLLLWCGAFGAALGGVVALLIDACSQARGRSGVAEHESTHSVEDEPSDAQLSWVFSTHSRYSSVTVPVT